MKYTSITLLLIFTQRVCCCVYHTHTKYLIWVLTLIVHVSTYVLVHVPMNKNEAAISVDIDGADPSNMVELYIYSYFMPYVYRIFRFVPFFFCIKSFIRESVITRKLTRFCKRRLAVPMKLSFVWYYFKGQDCYYYY